VLQRLWTLGRSPATLRTYPELRTLTGCRLRGRVVGIDGTPEQLLRDQERTVTQLVQAAQELVAWGASCVGLGAVAAVVGGRGRAVAERLAVPVTRGHSLTTWAALQTVALARRHAGLPEEEPVGILGAPGPVALGLAACLGEQGRPVHLAFEAVPPPVARYLGRWPSIQTRPRTAVLAQSRLLAGASSTGDSLRAAELAPGTLLVDVAQPRDLVAPPRRSDVQVVDGELLTLPPGTSLDPLTRIYNHIVGQGGRHVLACFAEPMVLAAAGESRARELCVHQRQPDPRRILELGDLAAQQGFTVDQLFHRGRPLTPRPTPA